MKRDSSVKGFFATGCLLQLCLIGLIVLAGFAIGNCVRNYEKKNDTTLIRELGKGVKEISNEFNKGFNSDTLVVDTLKQK
jgi:hypothetical protein